MGYSRYGSFGKGLSDRGQRSYNVKRVAKYRSALGRYPSLTEERKDTLAGQLAGVIGTYRGHPSGEVQVRGAYQIPGTTAAGQSAQRRKVGAQPGSQFGAHTTGYAGTRRGMPQWVQRMLTKGSALGKPPGASEDGGIGTLIGLATGGYLIFKVLV